jgi:hypothetical protein
MKYPKCPVKTKGLRLIPCSDGHPQHWTDQYGRVLEVYTTPKGKQELRPIGVDPRAAGH